MNPETKTKRAENPAPGRIQGPNTEDLHVRSVAPLVTPRRLKERLPAGVSCRETVQRGRERVRAILKGSDRRLLVVAGPCSIHDPGAALEYAGRLLDLSRRVREAHELVMRVYFEKPRTTLGWKGFINDPNLDGSYDVEKGLTLARKILIDITAMGLPVATEFLDPITPQYTADLVSWAAIGARTTESQTHRQMASGLSMPVGYKNGTDGNIQIAIDAMNAARAPHSFLGIDGDGRTSIVRTKGNPDGHLVLRGGSEGSNFEPEHTREAAERLRAAGLRSALMVDCSHANSRKDPSRQPLVWESILHQRAEPGSCIVGAMLESNLLGGRQDLGDDPSSLAYGMSITDACLGWEETEALFGESSRSPS